jgi:copper chaperone CopZ
MTTTYILENLCCSHCAATIESEVRQLSGVSSADLDAQSTILTVEYEGELSTLSEDVNRISVAVDDEIIVKAS